LGEARPRLDASQEEPAPRRFGLGDQDDDFALVADRERVHRVGEVRTQERRDALALEQALHDDRLRPIATVHGDEAPRVARLGRARRKAEHLPTAGHRSEYSSAAKGAGQGASWAQLAAIVTRKGRTIG